MLGVHLSGADLRGAILEEHLFVGGDLRGARFAGALMARPAASGTPSSKAATSAGLTCAVAGSGPGSQHQRGGVLKNRWGSRNGPLLADTPNQELGLLNPLAALQQLPRQPSFTPVTRRSTDQTADQQLMNQGNRRRHLVGLPGPGALRLMGSNSVSLGCRGSNG